MQLLDRYLQQVKRFLPAAQREDIAKELSANILAEMEDRESTLGRPLTEQEQVAILQQQGSPLVVAGRYSNEQRAFAFGRVIIGPTLFPIYLKILALNLTITVVVASIVVTTLGMRVGVAALCWPALLQFAIVTAIFAAIDQSQRKFHVLDTWNPQSLPPAKDPLKISRAGAAFEIFWGVVFVLCWLRVPGAAYAVGYLFLGPLVGYLAPHSVSPVTVAPSWQIFYLPILVLVLLSTAQHGLNFAFPRWTRNRLFARAALSSLALVVILLIFRAGNLLVVNGEVAGSSQYTGLASIINISVHYAMLFVALVTLVNIFKQLRLALSTEPGTSPSHSVFLAC
jgi:hypothetical protein